MLWYFILTKLYTDGREKKHKEHIEVYGLGNEQIKIKAGAIKESEYCNPITMYGCNKLYIEKMGSYETNLKLAPHERNWLS